VEGKYGKKKCCVYLTVIAFVGEVFALGNMRGRGRCDVLGVDLRVILKRKFK
jgi:hypothetical protein